MHYVVGDVHGCFDQLMKLLDNIENKDNDAKFIFTGDLIDRGPKVMEVLDWAMQNITIDGKYQSVRGNHEEMVIEWYKDNFKYIEYIDSNFKIEKEMVYSPRYDFFDQLIIHQKNTKRNIEKYIEFFQKMPLRKEITITTAKGKNITYDIVHAFDTFENISFNERKNINLWTRSMGNHENDMIIVHGHTPTIFSESASDRPGLIDYKQNAINLDGGCVYADGIKHFPCMLCAICLENLEEVYAETIDDAFYRQLNNKTDDMWTESRIEFYKKKYLDKKIPAREDLINNYIR